MTEEEKDDGGRIKNSINGTTGPCTYEYLLNCEEDGQSSFSYYGPTIVEAQDLRDQIKKFAVCIKNSSPEMDGTYKNIDPEGLSLSTNASDIYRPNQSCTLPTQMAGGGKVEDPSLSKLRDFFEDPLGTMRATLACPEVGVKTKRDNMRNRDPPVALKRKRDNKRNRYPLVAVKRKRDRKRKRDPVSS
jgi:hypothetical protein